jgi:hypothetical protein
MSQLGGQIETIDANAFLGVETAQEKQQRQNNERRQQEEKDKEAYHAAIFKTTTAPTKVIEDYPRYDPNTVKTQHHVETESERLEREEKTRNHYDKWSATYARQSTLQPTHIGKHPSNPYDYPTWQTEWPNGKPRNNHLEIDWNPVDYNYGGYLRPGGPGSHRARREPGQYRTHYKNGKQRPRPLANYTNESTHDEKGHIIHKGEIKHGALYPLPGDTHWSGGLVPYNRGPLPADYSHHSHHPGGAPRKQSDYLHKDALYDYVYVPGRKHITTARPQQTHIQHVPRKNTEELNSMRSELKKLAGQNKNLLKLLDDAKSKHKSHNARHAEQLDMIRSSAPTPTGIHHSAPTGATGGAGGGRKIKTGFGGIYRVDKSKSQKYPGGGRGGRGGGSGN